MTSWTEENKEKLRELWDGGMTATKIEAEFEYKFSFNSIIGKSHRMKLKKRRNPTGARNIPVVSAKNEAWKNKIVRKKPIKTIPLHVSKASVAEINTTIYGPGKAMIDLKNNDCRWPVDDLFCAAEIENGSYCKHHDSIAH